MLAIQMTICYFNSVLSASGPGATEWPDHVLGACRRVIRADACCRAGRIRKRLALLDEPCKVIENTGERLFETEVLRPRGTLLLEQYMPEDDSLQEIESCVRRAIAIACREQEKTREIGATTDFSRLQLRLGNRTEAQQCLAPIYGWFGDGFDAPDLVAARELFDEIDSPAVRTE